MSSGYLYFSDDYRHGDLIDRGGDFTDALPSEPRLAERQVALISLDGEAIDVAAVMTRGTKAASYKWRVRFEDFEELDLPLALEDLLRDLPQSVASALSARPGSKGFQLDEAMWAEVLAAIQVLRPNVDFEYLERKAAARRPRLRVEDGEPIVAYEHDAVGLSLALAGIDRKRILESWTGTEDAPFLTGLAEFNLLEDRMIDYDASVFGNWMRALAGPVGIAEFHDRDRFLTVINVNRAGVEHALGVDLVYYNHTFRSYVLVQYKRMSPGRRSDYEFRPDRQLREELKRMRTLMQPGEPSSEAKEFRLDDRGVLSEVMPFNRS